jgi:hypothetical protein
MDLAAVAWHVAVALRVLVAASSNGPGGYFTGGSEIVSPQDYMQNLRQAPYIRPLYMRAWRQVARSVAVPAWVLATR